MKSTFKNITDEQLAAFIDGNVSEKETKEIFDAVQTKDDLETLALAFSVQVKKSGEDNFDDMPDDASLGKVIEMHPFERLPMAGFLGNETSDNANETKE